MNPRFLCSIFTCLLFVIISSALAEEWDLNKAVAPQGGGIVKLCQIGGSATRYSNVPVPGYEPCAALKTRTLCDAEGRKLITSSEKAPHGYLDCSLGPRIVVKRLSPPIEVAEEKVTVPSLSDASTPKDADMEKYKSHMAELDGLLGKKSVKASTAKGHKSSKSDTDLAQLLNKLSSELPEDGGSPVPIQDVLKTLQDSIGQANATGVEYEKALRNLTDPYSQ